MKKKDSINRAKCVRVTVIGRVQGVGFRYFTQSIAREFGLVGWVRNNYNGTVAIYAEGPESSLDAFLKAVKRGPSSSHVRKLDIKWQTPEGKHTSFNIRT